MRATILLLPLTLLACTERESSPIEVAARRILAANDRWSILELERRGEGAWIICSMRLACWPDLSIRGECPESTPLRRWFEARGVPTSWDMEKVLWSGVRDLACWRRVDWEARAREVAAAEYAAWPPLPVAERSIEWRGCDDEDARARLTIDGKGEIRLFKRPVEPQALAEALLPWAEGWRDEEAPGSPSRMAVLLLCDRRAPFRFLGPVFAACRDPEVRIRRIFFLAYGDDTDLAWEIRTFLPGGRDESRDRAVRRIVLAEGAGPLPDHAALVAALGGGRQDEVAAVLTVDPDASIQHLAEVLSALMAATILDVEYVEAGVPGTDPMVTIDGVPVPAGAR